MNTGCYESEGADWRQMNELLQQEWEAKQVKHRRNWYEEMTRAEREELDKWLDTLEVPRE